VGETPLTRIRRLAKALERDQQRVERTREELHEAIREAAEAGEPNDLIAQLAGMTRQRVWQIVKAARSDG
jgi:hypothetical protein